MSFTKRVATALTMCFLFSVQLTAQSAKMHRDELQTEMYRLFYSEDSLQFRKVVEQLKDMSLKAGDEQTLYKAWGNLSIYESTHQRRTHALEIAREMEAYAKQQGSTFGTYTAIHVTGTVYHQMRDYEHAEKAFLDAIDYLHKNAPGESAAADYIELVLISVNARRDVEQGLAYARKALEEPNLSAQHRMRTLTMLCQLEGEKQNPDRDKFNAYFEERLQARVATAPDRADAAVRMLYNFVNGNYDRALVLADSLSSADQTHYEKSRIYHRMGDDSKAYEQLLLYKSVRDSMNLAERSGLLSEYITQLSNERLELEKRELERKNARLQALVVLMLILMFISLLVWIIWRRVKLTRQLRQDNAQLGKAHQLEKEARLAEHQERKQAEKQLDIKREYLNNIAHEIRSSLNPIAGFSDILSTPGFELNEEERQMMSEHIRENTKQMTGVIDHMIELSFYESKTSLEKDDVFSPNVLCQNVMDYAKTLVPDERLELSYRTDLPSYVLVRSDMGAVGKVLRQLMDNAVKFTSEGGVLLNCMEHDGMIRFMVTDTGSGIPPERQDDIFDPFVQTGESVKTTGMGLAICRCIASLLGGTISIDKNYRRGSRFIFDIPKEVK